MKRCVPLTPNLNHEMYANKLCCFAPSFGDLQDLVNVCSKYAKLPRIVFNASKVTDMIHHVPFSKYSLLKLYSVYIAGILVNFSNSMKYFGIHLN